MESNKNLGKSVLEIVDEQLRKDNPKATRQTFERLIASGYTKTEAKEAIAVALLESIWGMLNHKKPFDEAQFAKRLSKLKGRHQR